MKYKLIDVRNEKEENVRFGTCELCMRTGTNYYEVYVVQDKTGKQYEFESGHWVYGEHMPYVWEDIHNVMQFAEWFGKQDLPADLEWYEFWEKVDYYVYHVQGEEVS